MDKSAARRQMVDQQVRTWEVLDPRVLEALGAVPREAFVPDTYRELAYADSPLPIGLGQYMLAPNMQGRILQALAPAPSDRALEVGTGTGYLCACLSLLAASTHSIDIHGVFTATAARNLRAVPQARVQLETRDAWTGLPGGEYDVIAVTGSMPLYDARFERSLSLGGRLFAVVGTAPAMSALLIRRVEQNEWMRETLFETDLPPLINAPSPPKFTF